MRLVEAHDPAAYAEAAYRISRGEFEFQQGAHSIRYGLIVPVALSLKLFGVSDIAAAAAPLIYSIAALLLAGWIGHQTGGWPVALWSASLLAALPLAVVQGTDLHTDLPLAVFLCLGFACLVTAERATGETRARWVVAAGLSLGVSFLTKLAAGVLLPAVMVAASRLKLTRRELLTTLCLALTVPAFEALLYWGLLGDVLFRLHAETAGGLHQKLTQQLYPDRFSNLAAVFTEIPRIILAPYPFVWSSYFGWHGVLLAVSLFNAARGGISLPRYAVLVLFLLIYLPLSALVVDTNLTPAQIRYPRVLEPLCIPAVVLMASFLMTMGKRLRWLTGIAVIVVGSLSSYGISLDYHLSESPLREAHRVLRERAGLAVVYSDPLTCSAVRFLDKYDPRLSCLSYGGSGRALRFAIYHPGNTLASRQWLRWTPPPWFRRLPANDGAVEFVPRSRVGGGLRRRLLEGQPLRDVLFATVPVPSAAIQVQVRRTQTEGG